ncbi:hypothetical protein B0H17DRAFT_1076596 [Mycena rosella]|uniref:Uncharacterized protein n=1 Tax=Mycena rosella TaxID=1033263 RepID=A0AAD7D644_MYCRO|nr:hypothetical protein B0H17DRAFT_1076596 [Mycena rosella]
MRFYTDDSDEEGCDRSPTPTRVHSATSSCADTPFPNDTPSSTNFPHEKHFSVPFGTARLGRDADDSFMREESKERWSGEWNRGDIRDVIRSLRELKL